jgi:hypothetical protein
MKSMTLRQAARRAARSVTTLRRYIRSGRLEAEKRPGRFGPEYFVTEDSLAQAGLKVADEAAADTSETPVARQSRRDTTPELTDRIDARLFHEAVPVSLYQELQMKHEQLLVQYGMVRASGLRVFELRAELEAKQRELDDSRNRVASLQDNLAQETGRLRQMLRKAELETQGRGLEIAALREKVRALEMLTRNAAGDETIEKQFSRVMEQARRVDRMSPTDRPSDREPTGDSVPARGSEKPPPESSH